MPLHSHTEILILKENDMASTKHPQGTLEILTQLNTDYLASDQNGDVKRYEQILAEGTRSRVDLAGPNLAVGG